MFLIQCGRIGRSRHFICFGPLRRSNESLCGAEYRNVRRHWCSERFSNVAAVERRQDANRTGDVFFRQCQEAVVSSRILECSQSETSRARLIATLAAVWALTNGVV